MENALVRVPRRPIEPELDYPAYPEHFDAPPTGGVLEYWRILRRHKGALILFAFLGVLAAVLLTLPQTPVYQARTSLEIQDINKEFMNLKQVNPVSEDSGANALSDIQTQLKILQSDLLAERTLAKMGIATIAGLIPKESRFTTWRRALHIPVSPPSPSHQALLAAFARNLKVRVAGETRIVEVLVDSTDPKIAAAAANTLASEYIDQNVEARWQMSARTGDWLGRQLDDMRIKLERSDDALQSYARQHGLMFTSVGQGDRQNVSEEKLRQLQAELSKAESDRVIRQSRYETTRTATPETLPDVVNDTNLADLKKKLTDLRREEAELATTFKPDYSKAKKVRAEIASLESALARAQKDIVDRINNEYQEAVRREKLLAASYADQSRVVTQEAGKSVQYNILKREVDSNRQMYEAMLQRVKESTIASAMNASNIRVIDRAQVPEIPYRPSLTMNGVIGLMSGLFFGFMFVIVRARGNRTFRQPGDVSISFGIPELGVIPSASVDRHQGISRRRKPAAHYRTSIVVKRTLIPADQKTFTEQRIQLTSWQQGPSLMSDGFRSVLASILFVGQNGDRPRVLVVTSATPMEGKTTVASNLAIALAKIGRKVLLVDGDLRKSSLHDIFELDNSTGLADCLQTRLSDQDKSGEPIRETLIPNLHILTSGPSSHAAPGLLFSPRASELVAQWKKDFDMVIVDTPPMLNMPDARLFARMSDAVVLVVRAGHTSRDLAFTAQQRLNEDRVRVLGVVLNDWNPKSSAGDRYGAYNSRYYKSQYAQERSDS